MFTLLSDLHLEFEGMELPGGDVLLLAGDVCVATYLQPHRTDREAVRHKKICEDFFYTQCKKYDRVYYIAGNHEHYNGVYDDTHGILRHYLKDSNVIFLHNEEVELDPDTMLWAGTFWTNFNNDEWMAKNAAARGMNDFYTIRKRTPVPEGTVRFNLPALSPQDVYEENVNALGSLKSSLFRNPNKNFVVMTHHCPSMMSSHPRFQGDILNYAFCNTGVDNWIADTHQIKVWCHGHTHDSFDYMIDGCRILCNPRGYAPMASNNEFNNRCTFKLY